MKITLIKNVNIIIGLLLLLVTSVVACGPAVEPEVETQDPPTPTITSEKVESESDNPDPETAPSPEVESQPEENVTTLSVDTSTTDFDVNGIPIGFTEDGHPYKGDIDAPIIMKEFSDFQCPFCSRFFNETQPALEENLIEKGEVLLIFYDMPLESLHPQAFQAAIAGRCAGDQGAAAFWSMHDILFENPGEWSVSDPTPILNSYAESLDLDVAAFEECLTSDRFEAAVRADLATGSAAGINGTPSFLINEQLFVGAQPLVQFNEAIETVKNGGRLASAEPASAPQQPALAPTPATISGSFAGELGDPGAPIRIVEFTDYQCPYCSRHSIETMPLIVANLIDSGRVYYQLKDLPLEQIHPNARLAAVAARCAGDQNAYWEMHDTLFGSQIEWSDLSSLEATDTFSAYAGELGINRESFLSCLNSGSKDAAIDENISEARMIGVDSTPYFFVDGFPLNGARPYDHFDFAVSLAEEGQLAEAYAPSEPEPQGPVEIPTDSAYALGDENAPITIIEYTDYQCPFCSRHFKETYPLLLQDYVETGIVRYVLKDFPLTNIHPQAMLAAEAARCAGDQGAFFEMHDVLFDQQQKWGVNDPTELFVGYASDLGIDADQLRVCLENGDHVEAIAADLQEGIAFGVTGTPAFFLNGHLLSGAQPFAVFEQAIASLLDE